MHRGNCTWSSTKVWDNSKWIEESETLSCSLTISKLTSLNKSWPPHPLLWGKEGPHGLLQPTAQSQYLCWNGSKHGEGSISEEQWTQQHILKIREPISLKTPYLFQQRNSTQYCVSPTTAWLCRDKTKRQHPVEKNEACVEVLKVAVHKESTWGWLHIGYQIHTRKKQQTFGNIKVYLQSGFKNSLGLNC